MMQVKKAIYLVLICAALILTGCLTPGAPPAHTQISTVMPQVTSTPKPSSTLMPTLTNTPIATATSPPEPTSTSTPEPTLTPWPLVEDGVTVQAADGLELVGTFYAPHEPSPPWPGVILMHMVYGSRQDWQEVAGELTGAGYAVLALDMRGHGDSGGALEWDKFEDDLLRVWGYFAGRPDVDDTRTGVIGASIGANMALVLGASQPAVEVVVLLSPGLDYYGVTTSDTLEVYDQRPVLIIASDEDTYSAESSRRLAELAEGDARLEMYSGAGHGTVMFGREPGLADLIVGWLDRYLRP